MSRITKSNVKNRIQFLNKHLADTGHKIEYELMQFGAGTYHLVSRVPGIDGIRNETQGSLKELDKCVDFLRNYLYRTTI